MYEEYLRAVLEPLGVYNLGEGSVNRAELVALGRGMDVAADWLETAEREMLAATAEGVGLQRRESLFARRPAAATAEERRTAIAALLQIDGDSLTPSAINHTLRGCGIRAKAMELDTGHLRVTFPDVGGVPEEFDRISQIILDILPCHLEVEFYFFYLTWEECEARAYTWAAVEAEGFVWDEFQLGMKTEE